MKVSMIVSLIAMASFSLPALAKNAGNCTAQAPQNRFVNKQAILNKIAFLTTQPQRTQTQSQGSGARR